MTQEKRYTIIVIDDCLPNPIDAFEFAFKVAQQGMEPRQAFLGFGMHCIVAKTEKGNYTFRFFERELES